MGHPAIESSSLVMQVEQINTTDHPLTKDGHATISRKLAKLQGSDHIKSKESAMPFSLNTPRRVAPLLQKV